MRFHDYPTMHMFFNKEAKASGSRIVGPIPFYEALASENILRASGARWNESGLVYDQITSELNWYKAAQPYYNVYPNITKHLIRVHEEKIPTDYIQLPEKALVFRFADSDTTFRVEWEGKRYQLMSLLVTEIMTNDQGEEISNYLIWMDFGERENNVPVHIYRKLVMRKGYTVEQAMSELAMDTESLALGVQIPTDVVNNVVRCVIGCMLISRDLDDGLIEPDVLAKDREKWEETRDPKYVERAIRRGKKSWNVGGKMKDIAPSYRSPSPLALYWTGVGRSIPLLRHRRGTWVRRKRIAEIPHGYLGDDQEQE